MKRKNDIIRLWGEVYDSYKRAIKRNDKKEETAARIYLTAYTNVLEMKYDDIKKAYEKLEFK